MEGSEAAHLISRAEEMWFSRNAMFQYSPFAMSASNATDDTSNCILLRSDLHTSFDKRNFALVPKGDTWVVHVFVPGRTGETARLYHNVSLQPLTEIKTEYLFTRFAWTVFGQSVFLRQQSKRRLVILAPDDGAIEEQEMSIEQCQKLLRELNARNRSASPKKRTRSEPTDDLDCDHRDDELCRGRKRMRSFDSWTDSLFATADTLGSSQTTADGGETFREVVGKGNDLADSDTHDIGTACHKSDRAKERIQGQHDTTHSYPTKV